MKKSLGQKTLLPFYPVLILGTFDKDGKADAMNAAWGGRTDYNRISISLASHKTTDNILLNKEFTVSFGTVATERVSDYLGMVSGNKEDKILKAGLHVEKAPNVNAPLFEEYPLTLECKFVSFDNEVMVADVINTIADESILKDGKIDIRKLNPIMYDETDNTYKTVGELVGHAFHDGRGIK